MPHAPGGYDPAATDPLAPLSLGAFGAIDPVGGAGALPDSLEELEEVSPEPPTPFAPEAALAEPAHAEPEANPNAVAIRAHRPPARHHVEEAKSSIEVEAVVAPPARQDFGPRAPEVYGPSQADIVARAARRQPTLLIRNPPPGLIAGTVGAGKSKKPIIAAAAGVGVAVIVAGLLYLWSTHGDAARTPSSDPSATSSAAHGTDVAPSATVTAAPTTPAPAATDTTAAAMAASAGAAGTADPNAAATAPAAGAAANSGAASRPGTHPLPHPGGKPHPAGGAHPTGGIVRNSPF